MNVTTLISWVIQIAVAFILGHAGLAKLLGQAEPVAVFQNLGMEPTGRYIIGAIEFATALLLIIPPSIAWGAILGWGVMTGALIAHATKLGFDGSTGWFALVVWLGCTIIIVLRREQSSTIGRMFAKSGKHSGSRNAHH